MKYTQQRLTQIIERCSPDETDLVDGLTLGLASGVTVKTDSVSVEAGMVYARSTLDADTATILPAEDLAFVRVSIDRAACAAAKVEPTVPDVLEHLFSKIRA